MGFTAEELIEKIRDWECEAGESFTDYFMHDRVKTLSWAFWILGKGYTEHALVIIRGLEKGETYFDQEELFDIYPQYVGDDGQEWSNDNYDKNVAIWAEFLVATDSYQDRVANFFLDYQEGEE
jgi:hypothetical protein